MEKYPEISVVILCYRAEDFASVFATEMKRALEVRGLSYELVLVGNYHKQHKQVDKTPQVVKALAQSDKTIRAVTKEKEGMMGWDMRTGLAAATGEAVAVIDGDGQMPVEDVIRVYDELKRGNFDMAKTYRNFRGDGSQRIMISRMYNLILKTLFPTVKMRDANSKPKIFTNKALQQLKLASNDWFIDAEMTIKASYLGFSVGEVPTNFYENKNRPSFIRTSTIFEFLKNLIVYRFKFWFSGGKF